MSGECGYNRSPILGGSALAKSASLTLEKLNSMMKQMSDWREERLVLESNVHRLKSSLQKLGKSPDEALRPDPMVVHQRSEINRLELTKNRLEDEIRSLREALRESDQAITCSGAKRLKEKMARMRAAGAEERRKLNDEIGHLKLRVKEAEDDSSCSSLCRLRIKLREILNGDKKIERVIADVASRSCGTVIDLSNELSRMKELVDELRIENIRLNRESKSLKADLESAGKIAILSDSSSRLETIEHLSFHVKELQPEIEEAEDNLGLIKRVEELENALNESQKELEKREAVVTSLGNELLGAKTAYKLKSQELDGVQNCVKNLENLTNAMRERDELVADLEQQLKISSSAVHDVERLKSELERLKSKKLDLEIERDGLLDEVEKMGSIVSDRNEQIVKILEENEDREKAKSSEIEGVRTRLSIISAENESLKLRCVDLESEISKLNEVSEASGDRNAPFIKKIKDLEEELCEMKNLKTDSDSKPKVSEPELEAEGLVVNFRQQLNKVKTENIFLKTEIEGLKRRNFELVDQLQRKKINSEMAKEIAKKTREVKNENTQTEDEFEQKISKLEANYNALKSELSKIIPERDSLKCEFRKLISANQELNTELGESKRKIDGLEVRNEELDEEVKRYEISVEKLENVENELELALEEVERSKPLKASIDKVRVENEELKTSIRNEKKERAELIESLEKLKIEFEEQSEILEGKENEGAQKLTKDSETQTKTKEEREALVMNSGDYVRADRELKYYIHLQSLAVKRVVDFISYLEGGTSVKPAMSTFLEPSRTNFTVLNFDENLTATFRMSQKLSEKIFTAEMNVQKLESLKNERYNLRAERDCLNRGMEKVSKMLNKFGQEITTPRNERILENEYETVFWPSQKKTEISQSNSTDVITKEEEEKFFEINQRISSLQNQINLKQEEAAQRLIEMRETMRQERIRLMEIADVVPIQNLSYIG